MANKFPLILNTSANQIQEIASGDNLDLTGSGIHNAGVITATSFSGSGANLTGIDATSIKDSGGNIKIQAQASGAIHTGIHTFNSGAEVGNNIKLGNAGIITATTFKGDGDFVELDVDGHTNLDNVNVAGVATFASAVNTGALTATTGAFSGALTATTGTFSGNVSIGGTLTYEDVTNVDAVGLVTARTGVVSPYANIDDWIDVGNNIQLGNAGVITATTFKGGTFFGTGADINGDIDVDGHTNLDNVSIAGVTTFSGDVKFTGTNNVLWDASDNALEFEDAVKLKLGSDNDIVIHHTGGYNYIEGALRIGKNNSVRITDANDDTRLQVTNTGATVTGTLTATTGIHIPDDQTIKIGNTSGSPDLTIQHISSNSSNRIHATTGYIQYRAVSHFINDENNSVNFIRCEEANSDKVVKLACNGNTKLQTATNGIKLTGAITANGTLTIKADDVDFIVQDTTDGTTNYIWRDYSASKLYLGVSGTADITTRSDVIPYQNNTYNLGTTALRWANAYVNDMHFSNEGSSNSVDGTWGDWTLQEGDENIFMLNNRTGKKYKMNLTEVS